MIECESNDRFGNDEPFPIASQSLGFLEYAIEGWDEEDAFERRKQQDEEERLALSLSLISKTGNFVEKTIVLPALAPSAIIFSPYDKTTTS